MTNGDGDGWIGRWSPGIGDASPIGWLTVVLYLFAAWNCYRLVTSFSGSLPRPERLVWVVLAIGLLALGINKQLDLQSALTEIGRMVARAEGWYDQRRTLQVAFIAAIVATAGIGGIALVLLARKVPLPTRLSLLGCAFLLAFVVVRAASFHHMDRFISADLLGLKMNWIMEIGGISIIAIGAHWRYRIDREFASRFRGRD